MSGMLRSSNKFIIDSSTESSSMKDLGINPRELYSPSTRNNLSLNHQTFLCATFSLLLHSCYDIDKTLNYPFRLTMSNYNNNNTSRENRRDDRDNDRRGDRKDDRDKGKEVSSSRRRSRSKSEPPQRANGRRENRRTTKEDPRSSSKRHVVEIEEPPKQRKKYQRGVKPSKEKISPPSQDQPDTPPNEQVGTTKTPNGS